MDKEREKIEKVIEEVGLEVISIEEMNAMLKRDELLLTPDEIMHEWRCCQTDYPISKGMAIAKAQLAKVHKHYKYDDPEYDPQAEEFGWFLEHGWLPPIEVEKLREQLKHSQSKIEALEEALSVRNELLVLQQKHKLNRPDREKIDKIYSRHGKLNVGNGTVTLSDEGWQQILALIPDIEEAKKQEREKVKSWSLGTKTVDTEIEKAGCYLIPCILLDGNPKDEMPDA